MTSTEPHTWFFLAQKFIMNKLRLQALRRLLFFSRQEAALWVAAGADRPQGVTDRSWRMWEDGTRTIPEDVSEKIEALSEWRSAQIKAHESGKKKSPPPVWCDTLSEWLATSGNDAIFWRPQQSVCAAIYAAQGDRRAGHPAEARGDIPGRKGV